MPNPSMVRRRKGLVISTLHQLLLVDLIRYFVAGIRYVYFVVLRRTLATYNAETKRISSVAENTIFHNLKGLRDLAVNRSHLLVRPLSVIESLDCDARVLTIGPRTEGEILNLIAHGFVSRNIVGLDLITYSPWIELGDMHCMKYDDSSFDVVILGWVLAYSQNPKMAADEVIRVLKPGGIVAIGVEYNPLTVEQIKDKVGYIPGHNKRIESCEEILGYFENHVAHLYFHHPIIPSRKEVQGEMCLIFSITK